MRRLVTFVLALALGAVLLWHFESKRLEEASRAGAPSSASLPMDLSPEAAPLFGEVAEARFRSLAETLQAEATIKMGQ